MRWIFNSDEMKCHLISPMCFLILRNHLAGNEIFSNVRAGVQTSNDVVWGRGADSVSLVIKYNI